MKNRQFSFNATPMIRARRTKFNTLSHGLKTSMNVGTLYPIYCEEVIPGDTFKVKENHVTRLTSAYIRPPMDNIYQDTYFFFCPSRLYYNRWNEVFGENPNGAWANTEDVSVPGLLNSGQIASGSVADYLTAFPLVNDYDLSDTNIAPSVIPFRAFADIWNYYFRDENVTDPVNIQRGEIGQYEFFNSAEWSPTNYFGMLPKVSKFHDYFTSCLPAPQKGNAVEFDIASGWLPLKADGTNYSNANMNSLGGTPIFGLDNETQDGFYNLGLYGGANISDGLMGLVMDNSSGTIPQSTRDIVSSNLGVQVSGLSMINVNDLRYAFQLQKMLEKDSRGGNRYQEFILSHFGVSSPDMRMQVPEFLGGKRVPLNTQQVAQTAPQYGQDFETYLGSVGAYSLSNGDSRFSKGFTEHGWIIGVSCLRYNHTYQQGFEKRFLRRNRLDFYDPVFANIGEQPVLKSEIYAYDGDSVSKELFDLEANGIFGYQEAWADMRYRSNRVTGQMRSGISNSLDVWHFADVYNSEPTLSKSFIEETPIFVDRTIAVDSDVQDQFIVDFWFNVEAVREMPLYSIPGLVDHH